MKLWEIIKTIWSPFADKRIGIYASSASFYLLLSALPSSILLLSVSSRLISVQNVWAILCSIMPLPVANYIWGILYDLSSVQTIGVISISGITLLWSASKGMLAIQDGLLALLDCENTDSYFVRRIKAMISFFLLLMMIITLPAAVAFGRELLQLLAFLIPAASSFFDAVFSARYIYAFLISYVLICAVYLVLLNKYEWIKISWKSGAYAALGWNLLTIGYSLYLHFSTSAQRMYGSLGILIASLLWLKFSVHIILLGDFSAV